MGCLHPASAMIMILSYRSLLISKSFPYPSEKPHPNALIMVLISAFASTLSMLLSPHLRSYHGSGGLPDNFLSPAVWADPPAESPQQ